MIKAMACDPLIACSNASHLDVVRPLSHTVHPYSIAEI